MKKGILKLGVVLAIMVGIISSVNAVNLFAAQEKGKVIVSGGEVNEVGGSTSITYTFRVEQGTIMALRAHFSWDPTLMEFDSAQGNNTTVYDNETNGNMSIHMNNIGTQESGVTIKFKNVLPAGTTGTSVPINLDFHPAAGGMVEFGDENEDFALSDILMPTQMESSVRQVLPQIGVNIDPKTATVEKGKTQQFTATVVNDNSGVDFKVDGSSDSKIDGTGLLTVGANETATTLTVTATSKKDPSKFATATVSVIEPAKPTLSLDLTPETMTVLKGVANEILYTATPSVSEKTKVTYSVSGNQSKDTTISEKGLLKISADENAETLTVSATATNQATDPITVTKTATVKLVDKLPVEIGLDISNTEVEQGGKKVFTATILNDEGAGVTWEVIGAKSKDTKITSNNLGRALNEKAELVVGADEVVGTKLTVIVTSKLDPTKSATATVMVKEKGKVTKPTPAPSAKPSTTPSSSGGVKTADTTNTGSLVGIMGLSFLVLGSVLIKRKSSN